MNFKKTVLASAIALAVSGGSVLAKTSTVDGAFILDKTTVRGGDVINLALLGLDEKGEVDLYGEKDGSVIIAVVRSEIGEVIGGSINPGELPRDAVEGGNFAAGVKYVKLTQGTGRVHVAYEADTEGTDTLKVELLERTANAAGGVDFIVIESTTKTITVAPITSSDPLGLDITGFLASASDAKGKGDCIGFGGRNEACIEIDKDGNMSPDWMPADGMPNNGIMGAMTAGKAGGQIFVQAINPVAVGDVTVTLRKKSGMDQCPTEAEVEPISYTARMQRGQASVTLDDKVIKAGSYYIEATFTDLEGKPFSGDSVDLFYSDTVMVQGTGEPNGLVLCSDKTIVTKAGTINSDGSIDFPNGTQAAQGTHVKAIVVDEFGNVTSNNTGEDIIVNVSDANGLFKALSLTVPNNVAESIASDESLPATDSKVGNSAGEILEIGTTSLVATAINGSNEPVVGITVSDPLEIKVVDYSLIVSVVEQDVPNGIIDTFATSSRLAGTEFDAFTVVAADSNGLPVSNPGTSVPLDPGVITITTGAGEVLPVNRKNEEPYHVGALFREATDEGTYLIGDKAGVYGQVLITVEETDPIRLARGVTEAGIFPAAATKIELQNAHGITIDSVNPGPITAEGKFETNLYEVSFKLFDDYGNAVTGEQPLTEDDTGTFTVDSANAIAVIYPPRGNEYGIPGRVEADGDGEVIKFVYDSDGEKSFAGEDILKVAFTKPGLGIDGLDIKTTVPAPHTDATINVYIENTGIPINSIVAVSVELVDEMGNPFSGATEALVKFEVNTEEFPESAGDVNIVTPKVSEVYLETQEDGTILTKETPAIASNTTLNFTPLDPDEPNRSTPPSSKVFAVNAGAVEGQFSLTFYNIGTPEERVTKFFNVRRELNDETLCADTENGVWNADTETCTVDTSEAECDKAGDVWNSAENTCSVLPTSTVSMVETDGNITEIETTAVFKGGVQIADGGMAQSGSISITEDMPVDTVFYGSITFDIDDIGQTVDILTAALYGLATPFEGIEVLYYQLPSAGVVNAWSGDPATLGAYDEPIEITEDNLTMSIPLYNGQFNDGMLPLPGILLVYYGYRLDTGIIKFGSTPTEVTILP